MNWPLMIVAMLPEHLLLAGIAVLIGLNVMCSREAVRRQRRGRR